MALPWKPSSRKPPTGRLAVSLADLSLSSKISPPSIAPNITLPCSSCPRRKLQVLEHALPKTWKTSHSPDFRCLLLKPHIPRNLPEPQGFISCKTILHTTLWSPCARNGTGRDKILLLALTLTHWEFWCHSSYPPTGSNNHTPPLYRVFYGLGLSNRCVSAKYKAGAVILAVRHQISHGIPFQEIQVPTPVTCFSL